MANKQANIIAHGAEALIIKEGPHIIKDRISKGYRHPELDKKIIKSRTKKEAKILEKASKLINSPKPEAGTAFNEIKMPFIEGKKLSEHLEQLDWKDICKKIGNSIAKLHDNSIIHGDLTTSNMIWVEQPSLLEPRKSLDFLGPEKQCFSRKESPVVEKTKMKEQDAKIKQHPNPSKEIEAPLPPKSLTITKEDINEAEQAQASIKEVYPKLYFIDFGLGYISSKIEDRAVDLHLIKQALEAKHFSIHKEAEKIILENYSSKDREKVLEQLKKVESRGRYRKNVQ